MSDYTIGTIYEHRINGQEYKLYAAYTDDLGEEQYIMGNKQGSFIRHIAFDRREMDQYFQVKEQPLNPNAYKLPRF